MFERLKQTLVDSFVGAIGLGYMLAQGMMHFVNVFGAPVASWVSRREFRDVIPRAGNLSGFSLQDALPELIRFGVLMLIWYGLMRWLYFKPVKREEAEPSTA